MMGGAFSGGAFGSFKENGAQLESAIDEERLIGIAGRGIKEALESEVDGEGRGIGVRVGEA